MTSKAIKLNLQCDLQLTSEKTLKFKELLGQWSILYFYPKDNTPGCTREGQDFRDLYKKFKAAGAEVYGISRDSLSQHEKFKSKFEFPFELISDGNEELCQMFDVIKEKKLYGKTSIGIERSTFILDPKGQIRKEWRKVKVDGHAEDVLEALKELKNGK